ncbi:MAG: hypothetical protein KIG36_04995 [Eubacteriales bacterium]|nr:hypothetical protein [Eubacteriales bacterium]
MKTFDETLAAVAADAERAGGIGTLGEHTLHAVLKRYFEPHPDNTERPVGPYVADIVNENGVIEIQTGSYGRLADKLKAFLPLVRVTVVYPLTHKKTIVRNGKRRLSPVTGSFYDAFYELYRIRDFLSDPGLTLRLMLIDMEERRVDAPNRSGHVRTDRIPLALYDERVLASPHDYLSFVPETLPDSFTASDFAAAARCRRHVWSVLKVLETVGAVERCGTRGRAILYRRRSV